MITFSGVRVAPDTATVPTPMDIAVAMARITRYGGAIWSPLLAHSVLVAELTWRKLAAQGADFDFETFCWSLLHDAHEVVTGEIPRPWKTKDMKDHQHQLDARLSLLYNINPVAVDFDLVKTCDERALIIEAVGLGLPGFKEAYSARDLKGDKFPVIPQDEMDLGRRVKNSEFYRVDVLEPQLTRSVKGFAQILDSILAGDRVGAANLFRIWFDRIVGAVEL